MTLVDPGAICVQLQLICMTYGKECAHEKLPQLWSMAISLSAYMPGAEVLAWGSTVTLNDVFSMIIHVTAINSGTVLYKDADILCSNAAL